MDSGIASLMSSAKVLERQLETTANNLANVNTTGYKEDQLTFREVLSQAKPVPPESEEEMFLSHEYLDLYVGMGKSAVTLDEVGKNFQMGELQPTDNKLDLALSSEGFFTIQTPQGERFTRAGNFRLNEQSQLVDSRGNLVLGEKGAIVLQGRDIVVEEDGGMLVDGQKVDRLKLVTFRDTNRLQKLGQSFFAPVDQDNVPIPSNKVQVRQGVLEGSNVSSIKEMARMIESNRFYESVQKSVSNIDTMNEKAISISRV